MYVFAAAVVLLSLIYANRFARGQIECDALVSVALDPTGKEMLKSASISCPFAADVMVGPARTTNMTTIGSVGGYPHNVVRVTNRTHNELLAFNRLIVVCRSTELSPVLTARCRPSVRYAACVVYDRGVECSYTGPTYLVRETCNITATNDTQAQMPCAETVLSYALSGPHVLTPDMMEVENGTRVAYACVIALTAVGTTQVLPLSNEAMVCSMSSAPPDTTTPPQTCMCPCTCPATTTPTMFGETSTTNTTSVTTESSAGTTVTTTTVTTTTTNPTATMSTASSDTTTATVAPSSSADSSDSTAIAPSSTLPFDVFSEFVAATELDYS